MLDFIRAAKLAIAVVAMSVAASSTNIYAQTSSLWGNLEPGSNSVGFKVIYLLDYSRNWKSKYNVDGQMQSGMRTRPLCISVWYPAKKQANIPKALYREYVFSKTADKDFTQANAMLEERDVANLRRFFNNSEQVFNELMATRMVASLNAPPSIGSFPLIIYSSGLNDSSQSNVVLWEYLASHGYVVATVPQLGTTSEFLNLATNQIDLETQVRDLESALGVMHDFPNVDHNKLGVMGHSIGGLASLILQLRNTDVDAVIGLDASYGFKSIVERLTQSPYYQPEKMRVPFLDMRRPSAEVDLSGVNSFRYADKYFLTFPGMSHGDFTSSSMMALKFPTIKDSRTTEVAGRGYQIVCRYALNFLNAYLKQDSSGLKFIGKESEMNGIPAGVVNREFHKGLQSPPTESEFVAIIMQSGFQKAIEVYRKFKAQEPQQGIIRESTLNTLGYQLLGSGQIAQAVDVFKLNVEDHPTSANAYDSLAEAYLLNGDKKAAIKQYEKVLEVLPSDLNVNQEQKNNLRKNALEKLKELKQ